MVLRWISLVCLCVVLGGDAVDGVAFLNPSTGPSRQDYVDIRLAEMVPAPVDPGPEAATGTFVSACGRNEAGHYNSDNVITAPGRVGAAQHVHDYVGNAATNAFATDAVLVGAGTTCVNGDKSTYFWPVLRVLPDGGTTARTSLGRILPPASATLEFRGNPASKVLPMPRFLRVGTGDARAFTNGVTPPTVFWGCIGVPDRKTQQYPLCPTGSRVVRRFDFPSCWDGRNTDSPNHRAHMAFPNSAGVCPRGMFAVPQLRIELAYEVPPGMSYAIDSFPEQHRSPYSDHADFINVMPEDLMDTVVATLNR